MKRAMLISLSIILYISSCNYHKVIFDITLRANYIIALMEEYNKVKGHYPMDIDEIVSNTYDTDNMMVNSDNIPGKGTFLIYDGIDIDRLGYILVVGSYGTPNVIYFPKIKKKEINSRYFLDSF